MSGWRFQALHDTLRVHDTYGNAVHLTPKERALLAALIWLGGRASDDQLTMVAWGEDYSVPAALTTHIGNLRGRLHGGARLERVRGMGYQLLVDRRCVDVWYFLDRLTDADGPVGLRRRLELLREALDLWPDAVSAPGLDGGDLLRELVDTVLRRRAAAQLKRIALEIEFDNCGEMVPYVEELVGVDPDNEELWFCLAQAVYRTSGQMPALQVVERARLYLLTMGGTVGEQLTRLHDQILNRDERLVPSRVEAEDRPEVSMRNLPVTGSNVFGRESERQFVDDAWADGTNVVVIETWTGVGKSALVNRWLDDMAVDGFRGARRVFAWSFSNQGEVDRPVSADLFIEELLRWFGDADPTSGSPWERGQRLARHVQAQRCLLVLDGLEPLQHPPGPEEGRLKDPALVALLRELGRENPGMVVITTRIRVSELQHLEGESVQTMTLTHLEPPAGAQLLRSLGVRGPERELRQASVDYTGHALALTLLAGYLDDVFGGDVRERHRVVYLEDDIRHGGQARRVLASYESWFGPGAEVELLRIVGLFDRPVDESALIAVCEGQAIPELTEHLRRLDRHQWQQVLAKLRRARLLFDFDPRRPGVIDTHPLVRHHFGVDLLRNHPEACRQGNERLFHYFASTAAPLPENLEQMEPLFQAVAYGCKAGRPSEALHAVYLARIMRGDEFFAMTRLDALGSLVAILAYFFEDQDWSRPHPGLNEEDQLVVLMEAGACLSASRGYATPEVGECYQKALELAEHCGTEDQRAQVQLGLCRFQRLRGRLQTAVDIARGIHARAMVAGASLLIIEAARRELAGTLFYRGEFDEVADLAKSGFGDLSEGPEALRRARLAINHPGISLLGYSALAQWFLGDPGAAVERSREAVERARRIRHPHTQVIAILIQTMVAYFRRDLSAVDEASDHLAAVSARHGFSQWKIAGEIFRAWVSGETADSRAPATDVLRGLIADWARTKAELFSPLWYGILAATAEGDDLQRVRADAVRSGLLQSARNGERWWDAELHRLLGEQLAASGDAKAAERSMREALGIARRQHSPSLQLRAATSAARFLGSHGGAPTGRMLLEPLVQRFSGIDTLDVHDAEKVLADL